MKNIRNYVVREFSVITREDYNKFLSENEFNYKIYTAKLFKNNEIKVEEKIYTNDMFNKLFTINLC